MAPVPADAVAQALATVDRVIVLGANGWLGRSAVDVLWESGPAAMAEKALLFARRAHQIELPDRSTIAVHALPDLEQVAAGPRTLLVDCAYPTQEQVTALGADAYVSAVLDLRATVLNTIDRLRPAACLYTSSGAAQIVAAGRSAPVRTRVYGACKRLDELELQARCPGLGVALCIARVYAVSGPHMTKPSTYALGDFVAQARRGGPMRVRAAHPVHRSYVLAHDIMRLGIVAALHADADAPEAFETGGEDVEIGELARRVAAVLGPADTAVERPPPDGAPADRYLGDPARLHALADRYGVVLAGLDEQIRLTDWADG